MVRVRALASILFRAVLVAACLTGAVHADEAGLILPQGVDGSVGLRTEDAASDAPKAQLTVFVGEPSACCDARSPISGAYRYADGVLSFVPAFPFIAGQTYTVLAPGTRKVAFRIGENAGQANPSVLAIYPSGNVIPENTLRFYIEFSAPMQPHRAEEFIALLDASGEPDGQAFMRFEQELWNADRTRLTLLMDPGRIKRGVATNLALGPALEEGSGYSIEIAAGWPGATRGELSSDFETRFQVGQSLRHRPDPALWNIEAPVTGTIDPLVVVFDRPFDRVQLDHTLRVEDETGRQISGQIYIGDQEQMWRFTPSFPWPGDRINLLIDARLEDVAGNNLRETLDHEVNKEALDIDEVTLPIDLQSNQN